MDDYNEDLPTDEDTYLECLNEQDRSLTPEETCCRVELVFLNLLQGHGTLKSWTVASTHVHEELVDGGLRHELEQRTMNIKSSGFRKALIILAIAHELLRTGRTSTTRQIYYAKKQKHTMEEEGFANETEVARAATLASMLVHTTRASLGIVGASKGNVMGNIKWRFRFPTTTTNNKIGTGALFLDEEENDNNNDWISAHTGPMAIPEMVDQRHIDIQFAQITPTNILPAFILVVEKFTVFHNIAQSQFMRQTPCVLITGRGFPDYGTRQWLKVLSETLQIPIYGICDFNPHGISIMLTYACGSASSPESYHFACPNLRVVGLSFRDVQRMPFTESDFNTWGKADEQCLASLLVSPRLRQTSPQAYLLEELQHMDRLKRKVDVEALLKFGSQYLSDVWLPSVLMSLS